MSNEITIVSEKPVNQDRDRLFCLILYCTEDQILSVLRRKSDFRRAQWIWHDRDPVEDDDGNILPPDPETGELLYKVRHCHLVVRFGNGHSVSAVIKMFSGLLDEKGEETTVHCEALKGDSGKGMLRYLIHLDDPNKAQYDPSEVHFLGPGAEIVFYSAISTGRIEYDPFVAACSGLASGKLKYRDILLNPVLASVFRDKAWAIQNLVKCIREEQIAEDTYQSIERKDNHEN